MPTRIPQPGEQAPWFSARSPVNPRFHFDTVAGRYVVLCFFASAGEPGSRRVIDDIVARRAIFNDYDASFFGISIDPDDESTGRVQEMLPGIHQFWDFDRKISRLYGVLDDQRYQRMSVILDERLRVYALLPFGDQPESHAGKIIAALKTLPRLAPPQAVGIPAPVLVIPRVFEPVLCRALMNYFDAGGAQDSGFMREIDGKTVGVYDYGHKRRSDKDIQDDGLRQTAAARIHDRVVPEIAKAFQFRATRIERHIVACYDASNGGHFRPHRDNTTPGTAHRKFAVSVVLNSGEFEGGRLCFAEFGRQTYSPPAGGAVVFSCSLLHQAEPVTSGKRYCYLPFLYDEAAAKIREQSAGTIVSPNAFPDGAVTKNN